MYTNILMSFIIALITSPIIAALVSAYIGRIKNVPLLTFSKKPLSIAYKLDSVTIKEVDKDALDVLNMFVYDVSFNLSDVLSYSDYVTIITKLDNMVVALKLKDDSQLKKHYHELFELAFQIKAKDQLAIVVHILLLTMRNLIASATLTNNSIYPEE